MRGSTYFSFNTGLMQADLYEFQVGLVYILASRLAKASETLPQKKFKKVKFFKIQKAIYASPY